MKRALLVAAIAVAVSAHVGSPDVFFKGRAGPYDVRVVIQPPQVVPGVARVVVRTAVDVRRVSVRPVHWRAGSRGAPAADEARRLAGDARTFEGSLWLMQRGAYTVDVIVEGALGTAHVLVPVASVATGRRDMSSGLGALLVVLGALLFAGLVTIVYKGAGESLVPPGDALDSAHRSRARRVAALAIPVLALALLGGARWWRAVDRDYAQSIYHPSPLALSLQDGTLRLAATDTVWRPPGRPSALIPDHGKLMHLFLIRSDARAFAHLHPRATDSTAIPSFTTALPPLPSGDYHVYADVVHETGFERTLVGTLGLDSTTQRPGAPRAVTDPDDAWYVGEASHEGVGRLADGSRMEFAIVPGAPVTAGSERTIRVSVRDERGAPARLEPYLGMSAHAVVTRLDGSVYVHLHPMGTVTMAAQEAFLARDRGDTTASGQLRPGEHAMNAAPADTLGVIEFPYAFPKSGNYRLFVQVKRSGRILTGAFAIAVADSIRR